MNLPRIYATLLIFTLGFLLSCTERENKTADDPQRTQQGQSHAGENAQPSANGREVEIVGTVERIADGFVIWTLTGTFKVKGSDLSAMVGRNVRATGYLDEDRGVSIISVHEVKEIR